MYFFRIIVFTLLFNQRGSQSLKILVSAGIKLIMIFSPANISTSDQHWFNVVDQRWFNVLDQPWNNFDPTLKMKQNPTPDFQCCTTLIQRSCPALKQRWTDVAQCLYNRFFRRYATFFKRFFTVEMTLSQHRFNMA